MRHQTSWWDLWSCLSCRVWPGLWDKARHPGMALQLQSPACFSLIWPLHIPHSPWIQIFPLVETKCLVLHHPFKKAAFSGKLEWSSLKAGKSSLNNTFCFTISSPIRSVTSLIHHVKSFRKHWVPAVGDVLQIDSNSAFKEVSRIWKYQWWETPSHFSSKYGEVSPERESAMFWKYEWIAEDCTAEVMRKTSGGTNICEVVVLRKSLENLGVWPQAVELRLCTGQAEPTASELSVAWRPPGQHWQLPSWAEHGGTAERAAA